jgi:hypothetical protein
MAAKDRIIARRGLERDADPFRMMWPWVIPDTAKKCWVGTPSTANAPPNPWSRVALCPAVFEGQFRQRVVIEAASTQEAMTLLNNAAISVDVVFSTVEIEGQVDGFGLSKWVRENRSGVEVILAGSVIKAAHAAGDLCEEGPHLAKPYEPQQVVEWIKKRRNLKG